MLQRVPSFVGFEDFALLSGAAVCVSLVALLRGASGRVERSVAWVGSVSGGLGIVLSGAIAGVLGLGLAAAGISLVALRRRELAPRRALAIAGVVLAVAAGSALMRAGDIGSFFRFLGVEQRQQAEAGEVQSYSQRTLLAYIGLKIFLDHPLLGVGWQGSLDEAGYGPQLAAARARFPDEPLLAFPSPRHAGVHNIREGTKRRGQAACLTGSVLLSPPCGSRRARAANGWSRSPDVSAGLPTQSPCSKHPPRRPAWIAAGLPPVRER